MKATFEQNNKPKWSKEHKKQQQSNCLADLNDGSFASTTTARSNISMTSNIRRDEKKKKYILGRMDRSHSELFLPSLHNHLTVTLVLTLVVVVIVDDFSGSCCCCYFNWTNYLTLFATYIVFFIISLPLMMLLVVVLVMAIRTGETTSPPSSSVHSPTLLRTNCLFHNCLSIYLPT